MKLTHGIMAMLTTLIMASPIHTSASSPTLPVDSALSALDHEITLIPRHRAEKEERISHLRRDYQAARTDRDRFDRASLLFEEYRNFQHDSALNYAHRMEEIAQRPGTEGARLPMARIALATAYNSVGMFKEASDALAAIDATTLPAPILPDYYRLCETFYINLASYAGYGTERGMAYTAMHKDFNSRLLQSTPKGSYAYADAALTARENAGMAPEQRAKARMELVKRYNMSDHEKAVQYSKAGQAWRDAGDNDAATYCFAQSALYDIRSNTRETTAAKDLATLQYQAGRLNGAARYINLALEDAKGYNSRLRLVEINTILPQIENSRYGLVSARLWITVGVCALILVLLGWSSYLFFKLRRRTTLLEESHRRIATQAAELESRAHELTALNASLSETREIRDQFIVQTLMGNTDFLSHIEDRIAKALTKIRTRKYDDAAILLDNIDTKQERERAYRYFDTAFLNLFPNFATEFNALFPEEHRYHISPADGMPMEVRIFALMRLGIDNATQAAKYLNLSVNTIYVYKTRVKSRSLLPKEEFEAAVAAIPKP